MEDKKKTISLITFSIKESIILIIMKLKYIILIFTILVLLIYSFNFVKSYTQNKIISLLNSEKLQEYILLRVEDFLEKSSEGELTDTEIDYYSNLLNKIYKKYEPVINRLGTQK